MHDLTNPDHPNVRIATAQETDPSRVGELYPHEPASIFLGRDALGRATGWGNSKGHAMVVAGPRAGKGACIEIPTLLTWPGSIVQFSTRPDVVSVVAPRRGAGIRGVCDGMGQHVAVFDLGNSCRGVDSMKATANLLTGWLKPNDPECIAASERMAVSFAPKQAGGDTYFSEEAVFCTQGLLLHARSAPIYDDCRNLRTVNSLAVNGDIPTWRTLRNRGLIKDETPHDVLWESMKQNPFFHGKVARDGGYYHNMLEKAGKQWIGVQSSVRKALAFLDDPQVADMLCTDGLDMARVKTDPCGVSVFIAVRDDRMESGFAVPRGLIEWFTWEAKRAVGPPATGTEVLMWLDEFASLKRMDTIEHGMAQLAGNGVRIVINLQTLGQLAKTYGNEAMAVFKASCPLQVFFDLGHDDYTAKYVQEQVGEAEIITRERSHSVTRGTNHSRTVGESVQVNCGISDGENESHSSQSGSSGQVGGSAGRHLSTSRGHSFGGSLFNVILPLCFRPDWKTNTGISSGQNAQRSWGSGWNEGTSEQRGHSHQSNVGVSVGVNKSVTEGTSYSETDGWSEHRHRRPLIAINDALNEFVRIRDRNDPRFPGLILVCIPGHGPMVVRREDYFNSPLCYRKFAPDPEYPFTQPPKPPELIEAEDTLRRGIAVEADARRMSRALANVRVPMFLPFDRVRSMLRPGEKLTFPYSKQHGGEAHLRGVVLNAGEPLFGSERLHAVLKNPVACVPELLRWNVGDPAGAAGKGIYCSLRPANRAELEQLVKERMKETGQRLDEAIKSVIAEKAKEAEGPMTEFAQAEAEFNLTERRIALVQWMEAVRYAGPLASAAGAAIALALGQPIVALGLGAAFVRLVGYSFEYEYDERQYDRAKARLAKLFKNGEADL